MALTATVLQARDIHGELATVAQEVAHHCAHEGAVESAGRQYLAQRLRHVRRPIQVRDASLRTIRRGDARLVEVRLSGVVGFAIGGHPKVRITVVRIAPVETGASLP